MTEQISMIELFSGIGAQERSLRQLKLPYEITHTCDCDPQRSSQLCRNEVGFRKRNGDIRVPFTRQND